MSQDNKTIEIDLDAIFEEEQRAFEKELEDHGTRTDMIAIKNVETPKAATRRSQKKVDDLIESLAKRPFQRHSNGEPVLQSFYHDTEFFDFIKHFEGEEFWTAGKKYTASGLKRYIQAFREYELEVNGEIDEMRAYRPYFEGLNNDNQKGRTSETHRFSRRREQERVVSRWDDDYSDM